MGMRQQREVRTPIHVCVRHLSEKGKSHEARTRHDCNRQS